MKKKRITCLTKQHTVKMQRKHEPGMLRVLTVGNIFGCELTVNGQLCFSSTINTGGFSESLNSNIYVLLQ